MSRLSYPSPDEVQALLKSENYWPDSTLLQQYAIHQCEIAADAAAAEWENVTGWDPFLAFSDQATPREFYDVDSRGRLNFQGGAIRIESVTLNDNPLTGYRTYPQNALSKGKPITAIEFGYRSSFGYSFGYGNTPIIVNAVWAYSNVVPADVWQAILQKAALIALTSIVQEQSLASISEDGFNKQYDIVGIVTQKDLVTLVWGKSFTLIAGRYTRVVV